MSGNTPSPHSTLPEALGGFGAIDTGYIRACAVAPSCPPVIADQNNPG